MNIIVANAKNLREISAIYTRIYIARKTSYREFYGEDYSILGNPFRLGKITREDSVRQYDEYLDGLPAHHPVHRAIRNLHIRAEAGEPLAFVCFCAPNLCHGHIVKRRVETL